MLRTTISAAILSAFSFASSADDLKLCHTANAGFLAEVGNKAVLIDSVMERDVYDGTFALPEADTLNKMLDSAEDFKNVKIVLATHVHGDHFDAHAMVKHMKKNPDTLYIVTQKSFKLIVDAGAGDNITQVVTADFNGRGSVTIEDDGITVEVYEVDHGPKAPQNFGYKITMGDKSVFHTGDINASIESLNAAGLDKTSVDALLIPFWYVFQKPENITAAWNANTVVPTHFMAKPQKWMEQYGGPEGVKKKAKDALPNTLLISNEMQCETLK